MTLPEFIQYASERLVTGEQVEACCRVESIPVDVFWDRVAREVAHGYADRRLTFAYCDGVMNHLFRCLTLEYHRPPPDYAYAVFSAFDEGEYHHPADPATASAEDLHTRPLIAKIIADERVT